MAVIFFDIGDTLATPVISGNPRKLQNLVGPDSAADLAKLPFPLIRGRDCFANSRRSGAQTVVPEAALRSGRKDDERDVNNTYSGLPETEINSRSTLRLVFHRL